MENVTYPPTNKDGGIIQSVSKMMADELNQLSIDRREQLLEEIHGVKNGGNLLNFCNSARDQQSQQEDAALEQFQRELDKFYLSESTGSCSIKYPAYRYARERGSELVRDRDFLLTFLGRGVGRNCPKKGAIRMLDYLEWIREIYGTDDVLFRPICLSDLDEDVGARKFMYEEGTFQFLPIRDNSGRRVFVQMRNFGPSSCSSKIRSQFAMYFVQSIVEDRDGVVCVLFLHHHIYNDVFHEEEFWNFNRILNIIPPKFGAVHLCIPEGPVYDIVKATVTLLLGKEGRERLRFHAGSYNECKYELQSFGIPVSRLPVDLSCKQENSSRQEQEIIKNHRRWLKMREAKETAMFAAVGRDGSGRMINDNKYTKCNKNIGESYANVMAVVRENRSNFVECPRQEDCLFGKGRLTMNHPGNIAMRRLVENELEQFISKDSKQKSEAIWEVVNEIKQWNGRFLKEHNNLTGIFVIVDDGTVSKKIASAFRDLKKKRLRQEERGKFQGKCCNEALSHGKKNEQSSQSAIKGPKRSGTSVAKSSETIRKGSIPVVLGANTEASVDINVEAYDALQLNRCCYSGKRDEDDEIYFNNENKNDYCVFKQRKLQKRKCSSQCL